jgi:4-cresol dehydrogenase (hydroxylating)
MGTRPRAIIYPGYAEEVCSIVRTAAAHQISLYPISRGKNWGYGDACAVREGQVVVDLRRMNRIVEVNPQLAYAVIEPGVTQIQLHDHLKEHNLPLMVDCTGAGPEASIVGNLLDRGFGHTPYVDHMQTTCSLEVVIADGRVL